MMVFFWRFVVSFLVWLSADTERLATEPARAAAAVAAARAAVVGAGNPRNGVESVAAIRTPAFDAHAAKCKTCANRNPAGPGVCDEGRKAYATDVKAAACVSGTCGVRR
jgi:hypothetical protein